MHRNDCDLDNDDVRHACYLHVQCTYQSKEDHWYESYLNTLPPQPHIWKRDCDENVLIIMASVTPLLLSATSKLPCTECSSDVTYLCIKH